MIFFNLKISFLEWQHQTLRGSLEAGGQTVSPSRAFGPWGRTTLAWGRRTLASGGPVSLNFPLKHNNNFSMSLQGQFRQKIIILSSFTHTHVVFRACVTLFLLWNTTEDVLKNVHAPPIQRNSDNKYIFISPAMHPQLLLFSASRYLSERQICPYENLHKMPVPPKVTTPQSPHQL